MSMRIDIYEDGDLFASVDCDNTKEAAREALHYMAQCDNVVTFKQMVEEDLSIDTVLFLAGEGSPASWKKPKN